MALFYYCIKARLECRIAGKGEILPVEKKMGGEIGLLVATSVSLTALRISARTP